MGRSPGCVAAAVAVLALCSVVAHGQSDACAAPVARVSDASLHLALKDHSSTFREGEIMAFTAEYTANSSGKYVVNNRGYDRSGRLEGEEVFCLEPDHGTDPLGDYFNAGRAIMGGGLSSDQDPGTKPLAVDIELNEWKSLPPGSYRLTIVGNRLSSGNQSDAKTWDGTVIPLRSNTVEFEVTAADPQWQSTELTAAISTLDSPDAKDDEKHHAARILRFLGSEASTRELARRYSSGDLPSGWEFKFGLYGSPHRATAIEAMKAELSDPQHAVTQEYVDTLVTLEMAADAKLRLPPYDPKHAEDWQQVRAKYDAEFTRRINEYMQRGAASVSSKDPAAIAATADEVLQSELPLTADAKTHWRRELVANWSAVPIEKQNELIEYRWQQVGGPEWLPVLRAIVAAPPNPGRLALWPDRTAALRRIVQLAPDQGHQLLLAEAADPKGDIAIAVLRQLPERELPQDEAVWLKRIASGNGRDEVFELIDRFASKRALPDLKNLYEAQRGMWACTPQTSLLRYFLRVDPEYGVAEVSAALASRNNTGCARKQLSSLREYIRMPLIEKIAIRALDDSEPAVASDAAEALQHYGSSAAEKALWVRLEKFHQKWIDKPDDLLHPTPGMIVYDSDSGLEQALVQAIALAQGWIVDATALRRLKELASPAMQNELDSALEALNAAQFNLDLRWWPEDDLNFSIGAYTGTGMPEFKQKLAQFPSGSHFHAVTTKADREAHEVEYAEVENAAAANGQTLELETPR